MISLKFATMTTRAIAVLAIVCGLARPAFADDQNLTKGAKNAGHAIGTAAREIGHGAKKVGKTIGKEAKAAGKAVGHAAKEGAKELKHAFKGES